MGRKVPPFAPPQALIGPCHFTCRWLLPGIFGHHFSGEKQRFSQVTQCAQGHEGRKSGLMLGCSAWPTSAALEVQVHDHHTGHDYLTEACVSSLSVLYPAHFWHPVDHPVVFWYPWKLYHPCSFLIPSPLWKTNRQKVSKQPLNHILCFTTSPGHHGQASANSTWGCKSGLPLFSFRERALWKSE